MKKCLFGLFLVAACASYQKRKECEKVNWFQQGFDVAMSGKRLNGDPTVLECRKVEAKIDESQLDVGFKAGMQRYCEPETVFATGKKGQFFSTDLCFANQIEKLKVRHAEGVKQFCQKSNGFTAGTSGYVYNQICPENLEKNFLPEYRKGRKKFLTGRIEAHSLRKSEIEKDVEGLESSKHRLELERSFLAARKIKVKERVLDPATGTYSETERWQEDPATEHRRWTLDGEISQKEMEIRQHRKNLQELSEQLTKDRAELQGLEE